MHTPSPLVDTRSVIVPVGRWRKSRSGSWDEMILVKIVSKCWYVGMCNNAAYECVFVCMCVGYKYKNQTIRHHKNTRNAGGNTYRKSPFNMNSMCVMERVVRIRLTSNGFSKSSKERTQTESGVEYANNLLPS